MDQAAHANLEAVLWRDTAFLAGLGVMDYSLLVGLDSHSHRLVIGIIDFIRQVRPVRRHSSSHEVAQHMTALCLAHASSVWLLLCAAVLLAPLTDSCKHATSVRGITQASGVVQYTWDKQLETWVKSSVMLGGARKEPTVISPKQYCRRFRVAISSYFVSVPSSEQALPCLDPDALM